MGAKASVVVRQYENPVEPVVLGETNAANLRFGELTPKHARRERRRRRKPLPGGPSRTVSTRFW